jgi:GNAT superfamily N-acetyltransferase
VWEILLLVEKKVCVQSSAPAFLLHLSMRYPVQAKGIWNLVGYTTLYVSALVHCIPQFWLCHSYKFLAFPSMNWRMRVSQILIMPPFQRKGHGQQMLQAVYNIAETKKYLEVTVEVPIPFFCCVCVLACLFAYHTCAACRTLLRCSSLCETCWTCSTARSMASSRKCVSRLSVVLCFHNRCCFCRWRENECASGEIRREVCRQSASNASHHAGQPAKLPAAPVTC